MIAFLGLGRMGAPMARRLVAAGHQLTVWNRTPKHVEGALAAADPAEAVAGARIVVTMLRDPEAVLSVLEEAKPAPGTLVIEMSTIGPAAVARLRRLLPGGVGLVDAPVLGSTAPAQDGTLTVLAGGTPDDLARCEELLKVFGTVRIAGGPGAGAALKIAVMNTIVPAQVLVAETLAYADSLGVDRGLLLDVLAETPVAPVVARLRPALAERPATRYALGLAAKDLALAPSPVLSLAGAALARLESAVAAGEAEADLTAILGLPGGPPAVQKINPASVPATNGHYSHATRAGGLLFVSGQVALDEDDRVIAPGDMRAQAEVVLRNVGAILADQGLTFGQVTHIRTFVTDMSQLRAYGEVRAPYFPVPPASTTVEVSRLFRDGLVIEVEVVAAAS
ncbi:NAD(P)-binding domain-containing protein [Actinocorallia longicatena]|uniref:6-phosphogluconate dehydrogenase NADP-binding domain-containing protein n=1 Tax=Actinocorallia longicatena TaxID=111803 RepID=A0ABP6QFU9_9ACTN